VLSLAKALRDAFKTYSEKIGEKEAKNLQYMDPTKFNEYFAEAEKAHDEKVELKKAYDEEQKNKPAGDDSLVLAGEETETKKYNPETDDPEKDGFTELKALKDAGIAFEDAIHGSTSTLINDRFKRYNKYFPY